MVGGDIGVEKIEKGWESNESGNQEEPALLKKKKKDAEESEEGESQ